MGRETRIGEIEYFVCDICSEECQPFHRECEVCGNIVCPKGLDFTYEGGRPGCHTIWSGHTFCKWCWQLQKPFLKELYTERDASKARQIEINTRWRESSIKLQEAQHGKP